MLFHVLIDWLVDWLINYIDYLDWLGQLICLILHVTFVTVFLVYALSCPFESMFLLQLRFVFHRFHEFIHKIPQFNCHWALLRSDKKASRGVWLEWSLADVNPKRSLNRWYHGNPQPSFLIFFRGYNPYIGGSKPSCFMVLGSKGNSKAKVSGIILRRNGSLDSMDDTENVEWWFLGGLSAVWNSIRTFLF